MATKTKEGLEALFKEDIWKKYPNILADKEMGRHAEKYYPMSEEAEKQYLRLFNETKEKSEEIAKELGF